MNGKRFRLTTVAILGLSLLSGCGSRPATLSQIQGTVFFRGARLPGGMIVFIPDVDHGGSGTLIAGKIDQSGQFTIVASAEAPIRTGWHRVSVCGEPREEASSLLVSLTREVPARYRNPDLSNLRCEIRPGSNRVDIYLEDY